MTRCQTDGIAVASCGNWGISLHSHDGDHHHNHRHHHHHGHHHHHHHHHHGHHGYGDDKYNTRLFRLSSPSMFSDGMGWDKLSGTGVTTAQKFVQRPTPFLTRHSASRLGVGNPNEQTPPQSRANRRIHTDRSDPITNTIFLKSPGVPAPAQQKPGAWENQGRHESFTVSGCLV